MGKFIQNTKNTVDVHILYIFSLVYSSYVMLVLQYHHIYCASSPDVHILSLLIR